VTLRRSRLLLGVVVLLASLAALLPAAMRRWRDVPARPELATLVTATGPIRSVQGRLTGGFAWAPPPEPRRSLESAGSDASRFTPAVLSAVVALRAEATDRPTAASLAARGTGSLVIGDVADAIAALEAAVVADRSAAPYWSDLAAAYVERFDGGGAATDLLVAFESAERSLTLSRSPEALFNRALVLDRLNLNEVAGAAWDDASAAGSASASAWSAEARDRSAAARARIADQAKSSAVQTVRERIVDDTLSRWGRAPEPDAARLLGEARALAGSASSASQDPLIEDMLAAIERAGANRSTLRSAHAVYGDARVHYRTDAFADADTSFAEVERLTRNTATPLSLLARVYRAIILYRSNRAADAEVALEALRRDRHVAKYPSVRGRVLWTLGLLSTLANRHQQAIDDYDRARAAFGEAAERPNAAFVAMLGAAQLEYAGDVEGAWRIRIAAFAALDRESPFQSAAQSAAKAGWPLSAGVFYDVVAAMSRRSAREPALADALRSKARALALAGAFADAERTLEEARQLAARHDEPNWQAIKAEIALAESETFVSRSPDRAIAAAASAHDFFVANKRAVRVPEALLARARAALARDRPAAAEQDLMRGIAALSELRVQLDEWRLRAQLGDVVQRFGDELVSLRLRNGRPDAAFDAAEMLRAWDLRTKAYGNRPAVSFERLIRVLPADTAMLWYHVQEKDTLVWVFAGGSGRFERIPAGRVELSALVSKQPAADRAAAARLRALLVAPFEAAIGDRQTLVVVPDGPLHMLPFAALPGRSRPYLVEERTLRVSPNASLFAAVLDAAPAPGPATSALVIGNPAFDREPGGSLRDLPESAAEAQSIASLYRGAVTLVGADATRAAILGALPGRAVFHFAGHSLANPFTPGNSRLIVAGASTDAITASEISGLSLANLGLVMLSSCDSLGGAATRSEGPMGLARAFLSAGARTVVASQTTIPDRATRELASVFHREFVRTGNAAASLRAAQLALLGSTDPGLSAPQHWAPFVVIGAS
jgi:CHAT domain-containing protein